MSAALGAIGGWKVGAPNPAATHFTCAPLPAGTCCDGAGDDRGQRPRGRGGDRGPARPRPAAARDALHEADMRAAIASAHPAIEVLESRFVDCGRGDRCPALADSLSQPQPGARPGDRGVGAVDLVDETRAGAGRRARGQARDRQPGGRDAAAGGVAGQRGRALGRRAAGRAGGDDRVLDREGLRAGPGPRCVARFAHCGARTCGSRHDGADRRRRRRAVGELRAAAGRGRATGRAGGAADGQAGRAGGEIGASVHGCDATDPAAVDALFAAVPDPDVVLFNASYRTRGPFVELDPAEVRRTLEVRPSAASWSRRRRRGDADGRSRHDPAHGRLGQREGLCAIGAVRDGQVRAARAGAEHGARAAPAGDPRDPRGGRRRHPRRRAAGAGGQARQHARPGRDRADHAGLVRQPRSCWTDEIAVRPWVERF